jgi:hydroxypyruvate reductase
MTDTLRSELLSCLDTALAAVRPGPALAGALDAHPLPADPPHLLAVGKAAVPMARAATAWLGARDLRPAASLVVAPAVEPIRGIPVIAGDHPLPGSRSAAAADAIGSFCRSVEPGAAVWFLLSGGATSLMAGPEPGISIEDLRQVYDQLLRSGLDIRAMNLIRKRLSRWGGGKLAVALAHARTDQFIISDVIGDPLDAIGSGPMVPDTGTTAEALAMVNQAGLRDLLPSSAVNRLDSMAAGKATDLPPASAEAFTRMTSTIVASNRVAVEAAAEFARSRGWPVQVAAEPLSGEAAVAGAMLAERLLAESGRCMLIAGGETTVTLAQATGQGGRNQELALAAAQVLARSKHSVALLAAGTDGRDGPTDAAGGLVDAETWKRIKAKGIDPAGALASHDAYPALAASGDLLRTGATGTNVMDLLIGLRT